MKKTLKRAGFEKDREMIIKDITRLKQDLLGAHYILRYLERKLKEKENE